MYRTPPRVSRIPGGPAPAPGRPQRIDLGLANQYEALSAASEIAALRLRVAQLEKDNEWLKGLLHDAYDDEEWDATPPPLRTDDEPESPVELVSPPQQQMWYPPDADAAAVAAAAAAAGAVPLKLTPADHEQLQRERARQALEALREPKPTTPPASSPPPLGPLTLRPQPRSWAQLVGGN